MQVPYNSGERIFVVSWNMCARFANAIHDLGVWADWLAGWPFGAETGYNIAPTRHAPVLYLDQGLRQNRPMRWGLIPSWSQTLDTRFSTYNARSETLSSKPAFRTAWRQSRTCMVPVLGYYEWTGPKSARQPFFFRKKNYDPVMLAGLWDCVRHSSEILSSFTIITAPSRGSFKAVHPRMPLRVEPELALNWLQGKTGILDRLLEETGMDDMEYYPVHKMVNRVTQEGSELIRKSDWI